ncbi:hypothetical protein HDV00_003688 [Rhizophlyctis rosea]|nr:hypothetical protein HDV00_003688 [Rhizophlyctis rosea]
MARTKRQAAEQKLKKIVEARESLGLTPMPQAKKEKDKSVKVEMKWYHPTFNPHGPKKKDAEDEDEESESEESDSDSEDATSQSGSDDDDEGEGKQVAPDGSASGISYDDLSFIPLPAGKSPFDEAQIYVTLELPETRDKVEYERNNQPAQAPQVPTPQSAPAPGSQSAPAPMQRPPFMPRPPMPPYGYGPGGVPYQPGPPPMYGHPPPGMPPPPMGYHHPPMPPGPMYAPYPGSPYPPHPQAPMGYGPPGPGYMPPPGVPVPGMQPPLPTHQAAPQPRPQPAPAPAPVISAAPVVRNLQKELTTMLPPNLMRKKATGGAAPPKVVRPSTSGAGGGVGGRPLVNAAPDVGEGGEDEEVAASVPAFGVGGSKVAGPAPTKTKAKSANDEYEEFMNQMKDLL